jgi:hypothetical protein
MRSGTGKAPSESLWYTIRKKLFGRNMVPYNSNDIR